MNAASYEFRNWSQEVVAGYCCKVVRKLGPHRRRCLEVFGRDGKLHTRHLAQYFPNLTALEIAGCWESDFYNTLPGARFVCGDSHSLLKNRDPNWYPVDGFDLVSIDNPLGVYGFPGYCEHFDIFELALSAVRTPGAIMFNVVPTPFGADAPHNFEWMRKREDFYSKSPYDISIVDLQSHYFQLIERNGYLVKDIEMACRETCNENPYFYQCLALIDRNNV